jgi:nucleoside-diphosphate-sugar epimerase
MNIIFGGEGFIGRHLAQHLLSNKPEAEVVSIDLAESERGVGSGRRFVRGDVREEAFGVGQSALVSEDGASSQSPVIFNFAAVHRTPGHPEHEYFETNLKGAENVCEFARKTGARTIVFTSSIAPYGASESLKTEETLPLPNTAYGISKLVAEHIHRTWQAERPDERRLVIVRPGVVFGPGEGGNVTRLAAALAKRRFVYPGRKDTIKACIYVKDVARLIAEMAARAEPGVFLYNLTYEPAPTIEEICAAICRVTGAPEPKFMVPGAVLKAAAAALGTVQAFAGEGFHPDRVRKLMISNNISGKRLIADGYRLQFPLEDALRDWWNDCGRREMV